MNGSDHERAAQLIFRSQLEHVTAEDSDWLEAHLAICVECSERAAMMRRTVLAIRSISVQVDPVLIERTRLRVRQRAQVLGSRSSPGMWLWVVSAISWAWMAASASYMWRGFGWVAHRVGIPSPLWQMGFALWWVVPALIVAAVLSLHSLGSAEPIKE